MMKHVLTVATLAAALTTSAFAQQPAPSSGSRSNAPATSAQPSPGAMPQQGATSAQKPGFVQKQESNEWRGSKLVGSSVYGPDNQSIGLISDVIIDGSGKVKAAVVGVGGFLGVGQKDVAIPFEALRITRRPNSSTIDRVTVSYSKDDLTNAPKFSFYQAVGSSQTTGAAPAGTSNNTNTVRK